MVRGAGFPAEVGRDLHDRATASVERFADFAIATEVPQPQTWQVPRETFDDLLLRHAAR